MARHTSNRSTTRARGPGWSSRDVAGLALVALLGRRHDRPDGIRPPVAPTPDELPARRPAGRGLLAAALVALLLLVAPALGFLVVTRTVPAPTVDGGAYLFVEAGSTGEGCSWSTSAATAMARRASGRRSPW